MRIVINECYGGFGLSHKAIMRYAELSGIALYPAIEVDEYNYKDPRVKPWDGIGSSLFTHYYTRPIATSGKMSDSFYWAPRGIERNDPILVRVVEEMKEEANGRFAKLVIIEIPDDVEYEIEEYDGSEWVSEKHRTWR